jgi:hypothetical protein
MAGGVATGRAGVDAALDADNTGVVDAAGFEP